MRIIPGFKEGCLWRRAFLGWFNGVIALGTRVTPLNAQEIQGPVVSVMYVQDHKHAKGRPGAQWWDGGDLYTHYQGSEEPGRGMIQWIMRESASGRPAERLDLPDWTRSVSVVDGSVWVFTRWYYIPSLADIRSGKANKVMSDPSQREAQEGTLRRSRDFKAWEQIGVFQESPQQWVHRVEPLDGKRFLLDGGFLESGQASGHAIGEIDAKGALKVMGLVPASVYGSPIFESAQSPNGSQFPRIAGWARGTYFNLYRRSKETILCASVAQGWLLEFDGVTGNFRRFFSLYPSPSLEELGASKAVLDSILSDMQPRPDGTFLLAGRDAEFAKQANRSTISSIKESESRYAKGVSEFPALVWWTYDPRGRVLEKSTTPTGAPARLTGGSEPYTFSLKVTGEGPRREKP